jgi:hypothetical protein
LPHQKNLWLETPHANLVRYVPSGIYFSRILVLGKLIRRSLKTNKPVVAMLRPGDLEKVGRWRIEIQGAVSGGNLRFGGVGCFSRLSNQRKFPQTMQRRISR